MLLVEKHYIRKVDDMIGVKVENNCSKLEANLKKIKDKKQIMSLLEKYGEIGVNRLKSATPVKSSKTANSWAYKINNKGNNYSIQFYNTNIVHGTNIAILLQYGHGTHNGGYVRGKDYINPAVKSTFEEMTNELMKEVGRL